MRVHRIAYGLVTLVSSIAAAQGTGIEAMAPRRSFVVASVENWSHLSTTLSESELGALWREASVQAWFAGMWEEAQTELDAALAEVGIELEDLHAPTGAVGLAIFPVEPPPAPEVPEEEELWAPEPPRFHAGMIAFAEFGEHADDVEGQIEAVLKAGDEEDQVEIERLNHDGVEVIRVTAVPPDPEPLDPEDPEMGEYTPPTMLESMFGPFGNTGEIRIARVGDAFVLGNHAEEFEAALDARQGREIESIAEVAEYRDARAQHPPSAAALVVVLFQPLVEEYLGEHEADPEAALTHSLLESIGLLEVRAFGIGLRFDSPDGVMEQSIGLVVPEKKGIVALFDNQPPAWIPPAFVGADTTSAFRVCFRFKDVIPTVRAAIQSLPEEQRAQAGMFEQAAAFAQPILEAMGEQIHISETLTRPFTADSSRNVVALEISDTVAPINILNTFGQGYVTPREFEGNQVFDMQGGPGVSIGFGFGHVFVGQTLAVEDALRSAGQPAGPKLATEDRFTRASASIPANAVVTSYLDFEVFLRHVYWEMQNMDTILAEQFAGIEDEEFRQQLIEAGSAPEWAKKLPPVEVVLARVGDMVSEIHPTPDGFRGRTLWLEPRK